MEENVKSGGFGEHVNSFVLEEELPVDVINIAIPDCYVEHGNAELLKKEIGIDADTIYDRIIGEIQKQENE